MFDFNSVNVYLVSGNKNVFHGFSLIITLVLCHQTWSLAYTLTSSLHIRTQESAVLIHNCARCLDGARHKERGTEEEDNNTSPPHPTPPAWQQPERSSLLCRPIKKGVRHPAHRGVCRNPFQQPWQDVLVGTGLCKMEVVKLSCCINSAVLPQRESTNGSSAAVAVHSRSTLMPTS